MTKLNNNGYMLVEIVIASVIALVVAWFLIDVTVKMVAKNNDYYIESLLIADKSVITKEIMDDIYNPSLKLSGVVQLLQEDGTPSNKVTLKFNGGSIEKDIYVDKENKVISYGNYIRTLNSKLNLGEIKIEQDTTSKMLYISIPAYINYSAEDYGIKIVISYDDIEENAINIPRIPTSYCKAGSETNSGNPEAKIAGRSLLVNANNPDFSKIATTDEGMYITEDDLGNSCYFRGAVVNNYVRFGKNSSGKDMYWRIIRINGDGTIRMIYDGTSAYPNGVSNLDRMGVGLITFSGSFNNDNSYVGYKYGVTGSNSYSDTHSNSYDSAIKQFLEQWYENNLSDYSEYIADAIFCNDRQVSFVSDNLTGNGTGTEATLYKPAERLSATKNPLLTCAQKNDRFTVNSSNFSVATNGLMNKPIGLITGDEAAMAGGVLAKENIKYYLYAQDSEILKFFWTMSAWYFTKDNLTEGASVLVIREGGTLGVTTTNDSFGNAYARPVINLKRDALRYGTGTIEDPYRIS